MNAYRIACFTLGAGFAVYSLWRGWDAHAAQTVRAATRLATWNDHERMRRP